MTNLSEITTRGTPTHDDVYNAAVLVEEVAVIAGIIGGAQVNEEEFTTAMNGIATILKIASTILVEGVEIYSEKPATSN